MKKLIIILFLISMSRSAEPMFKSVASMVGYIPEQPQRPVQVVQPQQKELTQIQKTETIVLPPTEGPTTIHLHFMMHQNASGNNVIEVNNQSLASAQADALAQATAEAKADVDVLQSMQNNYQEPVQNFLDDNKFYLGAGVLLTVYSYYCYQVICGNFYLKRTDIWSSWKHELSFDQLCQIPQQTLARELILNIQHNGLDMQKPTDFMIPLVLFLQVIEEERSKLIYYQTLYNRIRLVKCDIFFPFNKKEYTRIEERLQRLSFVKNIFISWMAEFNVEHNKSIGDVLRKSLFKKRKDYGIF